MRLNMAEIRCISRNFKLKPETYRKLLLLSEERGFKDPRVFVTKKMINPLYRRIDVDKFYRGGIAKEPMARIIRYDSKDEPITFHLKLTENESRELDSVIKWHNYIDKYGKLQYSIFLANWIVTKWEEREEEKPEQTVSSSAPNYRSLEVED